MPALQKIILAGTVAVLATAGIYEAVQASRLRGEKQTLQQQQAPLAAEVRQLRSDLQDATNRLATLREENERLDRDTRELLKLRSSIAGLLQRNHEFEKLTNFPPANPPSLEINESEFVVPDSWANAGVDSATAAVRTYLWAMANTNAARLKEVLASPFGEKEPKESFGKWLDEGESARSDAQPELLEADDRHRYRHHRVRRG